MKMVEKKEDKKKVKTNDARDKRRKEKEKEG